MLTDGRHYLNPYELVEIRAGRPVRYMSLSQSIPDEAELRILAERLLTFTGHRVRFESWEIESGDPRDSGRSARVVVLDL